VGLRRHGTGIPVVYAAGRNAKSFVEVTLTIVIIQLRDLIPAHLFVGQRRWRTWYELFATPLSGGLGSTG
jgi:phosphoglycerate dehydrogenase-like enzyme